MKINEKHESQWESIKINEKAWNPMGKHGNQ